ncbi:NADH dehydrogenase [ubiquinone] 1 alpha subcomplex subunit 13 [Cimex lectularius]|uniref:NADH dehydrogenase [ubiquinone] 1 alpha subcomplex subunit 13 n=1 Tax=Cimex lectularius TaxID=79782 RepID=A0A8I6RPK4_CIMLE|nr:NADH dehydrogenase [ubiquinone] 1 alpha subcomplex subunit 13 [Cimex lectularius]
MDAAQFKQDMPPPGGFKSLDYSRVPARSLIRSKWLIFAQAVSMAGAMYLYSLTYKKVERERVEARSSMLALLPLLTAEKDREFLKQVRRNRDEEARLMANVEGWTVGTYRGEPIYKTVPEDALIRPTMTEYFVHSTEKNFKAFRDIMLWQ